MWYTGKEKKREDELIKHDMVEEYNREGLVHANNNETF